MRTLVERKRSETLDSTAAGQERRRAKRRKSETVRSRRRWIGPVGSFRTVDLASLCRAIGAHARHSLPAHVSSPAAVVAAVRAGVLANRARDVAHHRRAQERPPLELRGPDAAEHEEPEEEVDGVLPHATSPCAWSIVVIATSAARGRVVALGPPLRLEAACPERAEDGR